MNIKNTILIACCLISNSLLSQKISDLDMSSYVASRGNAIQSDLRVIQTTGVDFYLDVSSFESACSPDDNLSLTIVDAGLQNTLVGPFGLAICEDEVSSTTNNSCYASNALAQGFTLSSTIGPLLIIGSGLFNPIDPAFIGPDDFGSDMIISFQTPTNVGCFEFAQLALPVGNPVIVEVFGSSGSLGVLNSIDNGLTPTTICFVASENITSISISDGGLAGLLSSLSFGLCESIAPAISAIPTLGEWGLMSLGLLFIIVGVVSIKRRQLQLNFE